MDVNVEEPLDPKFLWYDYALFSMMLLFSAGIGIYYGFFGKKKEVVNDYLLGGKEMSVFPIAMSLTSSVLSAVSLTAIPADIYRFGATYWLSTIGIQLVLVFVLYAIIPVFYNLQLTSIYEYVELRFHRKLRIVCSILYAIYQITFLPIIIYLPALAIAQGTGFNIHYITMFFSTVCIFYTTIGGFKAVIWTDTMQFVIMAGTAIMITVIGTSASGGFQKIWEDSLESGRFHIDFDPDPRKRDTFWTICVGLVIYWFQYVGVNQSCIQKCISLPSMAHIKKSFILFGLGIALIYTTGAYTGLIMYSQYKDCDPFNSKQIQAHDQLVTYYILHVANNVPGFVGLFIAGVFSASLSSLSAIMNSLACTIYTDLVSSKVRIISQKNSELILKSIVVVIGIISTGLVFVIERMGSVLPVMFGFSAVSAGPILGLFCLGMFVPFANTKGALCGILGSLSTMVVIFTGSQYYKMSKNLVYETKPLSTEGCIHPFNVTTLGRETFANEAPFIFSISHYYNTLIGAALVFLIGVPISLYFRSDNCKVDKKLLSPLIRGIYKQEVVDKQYTLIPLKRGQDNV